VSKAEIVVISPRGGIELWAELKPKLRSTTLGFHKRWWIGVTLFHPEGRKYRIEHVRPDEQIGAISKVLAHTVYNPWVDTHLEYALVGSYALSELKSAIRIAIDLDDDVLTQFHDSAELLDLLERADDFAAVVSVIQFTQRP
jgi:hypothetical protein